MVVVYYKFKIYFFFCFLDATTIEVGVSADFFLILLRSGVMLPPLDRSFLFDGEPPPPSVSNSFFNLSASIWSFLN